LLARLQNCENQPVASSCMLARLSVCASVRKEQFGSQWADIDEIRYLSFRKSAEKIQVSLKRDKNNGYFTWGPIEIVFNCCSTVHFDKYKLFPPTNALFIKI
jgi:hypothetical protein